jgi:mono/diheme cytochrome c family protein
MRPGNAELTAKRLDLLRELAKFWRTTTDAPEARSHPVEKLSEATTISVFKKLLIGALALGCLGILGFGALAWRPAIAPIAPPPPQSFAPELIAKGEALAGGGYCAECHTAKGGQKFAGGYPMPTPFGVLYSTNITPDPETGIGTWSEAAFARAMHEGVARDGSHLFPGSPTTISPSCPATTSRHCMPISCLRRGGDRQLDRAAVDCGESCPRAMDARGALRLPAQGRECPARARANATPLSRRGFLIGAAGASLAFGFTKPGLSETNPTAPVQGAFEPAIWYSMERDGIVTVNIIRAEMGQHIGTALARILADEFEVDWDNVRLDPVDSGAKWGLMVTGGSWSVWMTFPVFGRAGAAGRMPGF